LPLALLHFLAQLDRRILLRDGARGYGGKKEIQKRETSGREGGENGSEWCARFSQDPARDASDRYL